MTLPFPIRFLMMLAMLFCGSLGASAAEASVQAQLSDSSAAIGEGVQLELSISGSTSPNPPTLSVDGLNFAFRGKSVQISMVNGDVSRNITYTYIVTGTREGDFTIPAIELDIDGRKYASQPLSLKIQGGKPIPGPDDNVVTDNEEVFAQIKVEKKEAYVGESLPAEVKLYILSSVQAQLTNVPRITSDGFSAPQFSRPAQRRIQTAGKDYVEVSFRTNVTANKAGKLSLGPVTVPVLTQRMEDGGRRRGLFGQFFGSPSQPQELQVLAPAIEMEIKPLPSEGRPPGFSGAIGKFDFHSNGTPGRVKAGEPVEMKLLVRGRGNFDRISIPQLMSPDVWQTYPPSDGFEPGDETSYSGTKTFTQNVVPLSSQTQMPIYEFSYFDPETKSYVTLQSTPQPLEIIGALPTLAPKADPTPQAPKDEKPKGPDILGIAAQPGTPASFQLPFSDRGLAGWLLFPLPIVLGAVALHFRKPNPEANRKKALRKERALQLAAARSATSRATLLDAAVHVMQLDVSIATSQAIANITETEVLGSRKLDESTSAAVKRLFSERAELLYMGGGEGGPVSTTDKDRVLQTLEDYERSAPQ